MGIPSLKEPVMWLSQSIQQGMAGFYKTQKILFVIASSTEEGISEAEQAIVHLKNAKALFADKAESVRSLLHSSYRHAADVALVCQMPSYERDSVIASSLESARIIWRDFSHFNDEFGKALTQLEHWRPFLLLSRRQDPPTDGDVSTHEIIANLFVSLHSMQTYLKEIIIFWGEHAEVLSHDVISSQSSDARSFDNHNLPETWFGYQRALLDASSSIAESVDAMSVEPRRPNSQQAPQPAQVKEGPNASRVLRRFWRMITLMDLHLH